MLSSDAAQLIRGTEDPGAAVQDGFLGAFREQTLVQFVDIETLRGIDIKST